MLSIPHLNKKILISKAKEVGYTTVKMLKGGMENPVFLKQCYSAYGQVASHRPANRRAQNHYQETECREISWELEIFLHFSKAAKL